MDKRSGVVVALTTGFRVPATVLALANRLLPSLDVVVFEPADIVAAEAKGLNRLYVALTRAVTSLTVLPTKKLPAALA